MTNEKKLTTLVSKEVKNVRQNLNKYIQNALLSIVGLETKYNGDMEIDHCNGRNSLLIDAFRNLAQDEAKKIAKTYKLSDEEKSTFTQAFKREISSQMGYALRDVARTFVEERAKVLLKEMETEIDEEIKEQLKSELG
mgnify:CR=1 FL=1